MRIISVTQGSPEWANLRAQHNTASEAPAMMGTSKYQTRDELLRQKATGIVPEVSRHQQAIFERGHATEAAARLILEEMTGEDFYPITAVSDDGTLLASVDGITLDDSTLFEHKLFNEKLAGQVRAGDLDPHYYFQLEQQLLVTGAKKVIFVCSDGTRENWVQMTYFPVPGRAEQLQAGWAQFDIDKANYVPTEAAPVVVATAITALPAVSVQVTGSISIKDNFAAFEVALKDFIEHRLIRKPETDQDFADLDTQIKALKGAESALDALETQMLSQVEAVDLAKRTKDMLLKMARENRLMAEKLLAARKDQIKVEQVQRGQKALAEHVASLNVRLGHPWMPPVIADFAASIKGLRTVDSLKNAIETLLANTKIAANEVADLIQINIQAIPLIESPFSLVDDFAKICTKPADDFKALMELRVRQHKERMDATRARIRVEEQAKAEADARLVVAQELEAAAKARDAVSAAVTVSQQKNELQAKVAAQVPDLRQVSAPAANVVPMRTALVLLAAQTPPTLKLGQISERLGFSLTGDFLKNLGFEPAARDKNAVLFHEADFPLMCMRLVAHIQGVQARQAA